MELSTENLILKTVTEIEIDEISRMWKYPATISNFHARRIFTKMKRRHSQNQIKSINYLCFGIFQKENPDKVIGWCTLDGRYTKKTVILFCVITEELRCKGYATQCTKALLRYAMVDMQYDFVIGKCKKEDQAAYKVMQKAGMRNNVIVKTGFGFYMDREMLENLK